MKGPENHWLVYGAGGTGKSTLAAKAAAFVHKTWGKITRVISADGGGYKPYKPLIDEGMVEFWPIDFWDEVSIFGTLNNATKGYWPEDVDTPNSPLLPGVKTFRVCNKCGKDSGAVGMEMVKRCASCDFVYAAGLRLPKTTIPINGLENVGLIVYEGVEAFGNMMLNRLRLIDSAGGHSISDGSGEDLFKISQAGMQHFGNAQTYIKQYIANAKTLPIPFVIWTTLELRGKDEYSGQPTYGPSFPGKALTTKCIPWFTDVMHLDTEALMVNKKPILDESGQVKTKRRVFLDEHFPVDTSPYGFKAKSSGPREGGMPTVLDVDIKGNVVKDYFDHLESSYKKAKELLLG